MKKILKNIQAMSLILLILLVSFQNLQITAYANIDETEEISEIEEIQETGIFGLDLEAPLSILVDVNTGIILHQQGIHERAYPASMTKVMTALLLLESGRAMDERIIHSRDAIFSLSPGASHIAMDFDETLTVEEALYAIMLPSANEVSNAIAEFLGGTLENFAMMMTRRAHELGAFNTNFANAHGLFEEEHYTTPYDMYLIMRQAISHEKFIDVISTQRYDIPPTEKQPEYRVVFNTNRQLFPGQPHYNPDIVGSKTGFTTPSRHTLVSYGQRDDMRLISVIMRAERSEIMYNDTRKLMDFGFEGLEEFELFSSAEFVTEIDLIQRDEGESLRIGSLTVRAEDNIIVHLPRAFNTDQITTDVQISDRVWAPTAINTPVGRVDLIYNGNIIGTTRLVTAEAGAALDAETRAAMFPPDSQSSPRTPSSASGESEPGGFSLAFVFILLCSIVGLYLLVKFIKILRFTGSGYNKRRPSNRPEHRYRYRYK
ncbi:MAG: D-alanyl-D-alanine carboxypeptidase [Defluviitaleaceae bacterium]|nr:D-alanyl-D-alanine carboxypeptidase [Defluviitaleaceae bacterium]